MSLLEIVATFFANIESQADLSEIPRNEINRVEKLVMRRAVELAREYGKHEGPALVATSGYSLGKWACKNHPDDAKAVSWWDSLIWDEMDDADIARFVPEAMPGDRTWQVVVDNGVESWLGPAMSPVTSPVDDFLENHQTYQEDGTYDTRKSYIVEAVRSRASKIAFIKTPTNQEDLGQFARRCFVADAAVIDRWDQFVDEDSTTWQEAEAAPNMDLIPLDIFKNACEIISKANFREVDDLVKMYLPEVLWPSRLPENRGRAARVCLDAIKLTEGLDDKVARRVWSAKVRTIYDLPAELTQLGPVDPNPKDYAERLWWLMDATPEEMVEMANGTQDLEARSALFNRFESLRKKRKRDDRETVGQKRGSVPLDLAVPHSGAKDLTQPAFRREPVPLEDLSVNVHGPEFVKVRRKWLGGSDAPKCVGDPWNNPNDIIKIMRGEKLKPAVDLRGWQNMCMGHEAEPVALNAFCSLGCKLDDSTFCPIPGTMMVITPDTIIRAENAGDTLARFFCPPFTTTQSGEVKSHVNGIKYPGPKTRQSDGETYFPHGNTFIQGLLQWFAVNGLSEVPEGVVPSFFLIDHYPDGDETAAWHVSFPDTSYAIMLLHHLERFRQALLAKEPPHIPYLDLPHETVVCEQIM